MEYHKGCYLLLNVPVPMTAPPDPSRDLVPAGENRLGALRSQLPEIVARAGKAAIFAAEEFFFGRIRNQHTRAAYLHAVKSFLAWCALIVTKLALAALSRQDIPEAQRRPHTLYADEVQNFIHGVDFPTILAEARKYRLGLVIASQTIEQLPDKSAAAVFGNAATLTVFGFLARMPAP